MNWQFKFGFPFFFPLSHVLLTSTFPYLGFWRDRWIWDSKTKSSPPLSSSFYPMFSVLSSPPLPQTFFLELISTFENIEDASAVLPRRMSKQLTSDPPLESACQISFPPYSFPISFRNSKTQDLSSYKTGCLEGISHWLLFSRIGIFPISPLEDAQMLQLDSKSRLASRGNFTSYTLPYFLQGFWKNHKKDPSSVLNLCSQHFPPPLFLSFLQLSTDHAILFHHRCLYGSFILLRRFIDWSKNYKSW